MLEKILPQLLAEITRKPRYKVVPGVDFTWAPNLWTHNIFRVLELIFWAGGASEVYGDRIYPSITTEVNDGIECAQAYTFEASVAVVEVMVRQALKTLRLPKIRKVYLPQLAFAGMPSMRSYQSVPYVFAIAFDNFTSYDGPGNENTSTFSHTNTGSNLFMVVHTRAVSGTETVTGTTYNAVSMTKSANLNVGVASNDNISFFYKAGPSSGANNVVVSSSNSNLENHRAASYTGASQGAIDNTGSTNPGNSGATSLSLSITSVADNCWITAGLRNEAGDFTASVGTLRGAGNAIAICDNGPKTPAGSVTVTATHSAHYDAAMGVTFAPAAAGGGGVKPRINLPLLGVG